jgi:hypothetical protein
LVPILLAAVIGFSVLIVFIGLARTSSADTAQIVEERLETYTSGSRPLTVDEI